MADTFYTELYQDYLEAANTLHSEIVLYPPIPLLLDEHFSYSQLRILLCFASLLIHMHNDAFLANIFKIQNCNLMLVTIFVRSQNFPSFLPVVESHVNEVFSNVYIWRE